MNTQIFINLPVADLPRSLSFFKALGYTHNPQFTDDTAACIVISDEIHVMALTHAKFREFTSKTICDTSKSTEVLLCLVARVELKSRSSSPRLFPLAARNMPSRRTTALCIKTVSKTRTATNGNLST